MAFTNTPKQRAAIASLALAASTLVGLALHEGYTDRAVIPVPGDVPTKGFGTTRNADGSPVKMQDTTTPQRALVDLLRDANKFEAAVTLPQYCSASIRSDPIVRSPLVRPSATARVESTMSHSCSPPVP